MKKDRVAISGRVIEVIQILNPFQNSFNHIPPTHEMVVCSGTRQCRGKIPRKNTKFGQGKIKPGDRVKFTANLYEKNGITYFKNPRGLRL